MNMPLRNRPETSMSISEHELDACLACPSSVTIHKLAEAFGNAVDAKDRHTARHSAEVAAVAELLARAMGLPWAMVGHIDLAGHLHDIGKLGIPDRILRKPNALHSWEWAIMRRHPEIGVTILTPCFPMNSFGVLHMVAAHHERYDGSGYPKGLARRDIPLGARILGVADSYAAMRQNRYYRAAKSHDEAMDEIIRYSGTLYDPDVTREFVRNDVMIQELWDSLMRRKGQVAWQVVDALVTAPA